MTKAGRSEIELKEARAQLGRLQDALELVQSYQGDAYGMRTIASIALKRGSESQPFYPDFMGDVVGKVFVPFESQWKAMESLSSTGITKDTRWEVVKQAGDWCVLVTTDAEGCARCLERSIDILGKNWLHLPEGERQADPRMQALDEILMNFIGGGDEQVTMNDIQDSDCPWASPDWSSMASYLRKNPEHYLRLLDRIGEQA